MYLKNDSNKYDNKFNENSNTYNYQEYNDCITKHEINTVIMNIMNTRII